MKTAPLFALSLAACVARTAPKPTAPKPEPPRDAEPAPPRERDPVASLDELAARGATEAPLMRVAMRLAKASPRSDELRIDRDLCVRAALAASAPVRAWIEDGGGSRRGEAASGAWSMVPPQGPACAKKGEALRLVVDGAPEGATVRAIIFAAP